ncbi:hypothetical protein BSZ39_07545 [Bowdeniella nasicola]|uniref:DUF4440 domain-containing protein n=1 Tax=Bowdeniella nasicola TaxID=208480 RepID=A0A1Q5Q2B9_9ACTO|nr:nuclear transport factor 2 family protein [Bowdeniella nasicola]OKL53812.1 hypothetical protein BSZ39_07545 [Bowdeniella nasicola]
MTQADIDRVLELERELQRPDVRADAQRLLALLAEDFIEIGASGKRWDRASILDMLEREAAAPVTIEIENLEGRALSRDIVQVLWDCVIEGRRPRRMSLWRRTETGWQTIYHQGTPAP